MSEEIQILIPMSGFGERFRQAGYRVPKPLIEIDGKPIISYVINMFPNEKDFTFICNQEHLDNAEFRVSAILNEYCPSGRVVGIPPHKLGPVHAVQQIKELLEKDQPVLVNYCDFCCYWDWEHFKAFIQDSRCVGAIPAYKGFHPHSLGSTKFAYVKEAEGWVEDIQEKQPFTDNRIEEFASSGAYFFSSAELMLQAFDDITEQGLSVGGEYYVSMAYKPLLAAQRAIAVYPLQHFMQWGTPDDLAEYQTWSKIFRKLMNPVTVEAKTRGASIIPLAGKGERFARAGYKQVKPLILVSGSPMVVQAAHDLPPSEKYVFVLRSNMYGYKEITKKLENTYSAAIIKSIDHVTEGQACTALIGLDTLQEVLGEVPNPITIGACDNGVLYDSSTLNRMLDDTEIDVIVWASRGHPNAIRHPEMYGWIEAHGNSIRSISVKKPLDNPEVDAIVIGTFTFRKAENFRQSINSLLARKGRVHGEYFIDDCINDAIKLGMRCKIFEVDHYLCWGTPNDLSTFEYWQSCFHKWKEHPYKIEHDKRVPDYSHRALINRYRKVTPWVPK